MRVFFIPVARRDFPNEGMLWYRVGVWGGGMRSVLSMSSEWDVHGLSLNEGILTRKILGL